MPIKRLTFLSRNQHHLCRKPCPATFIAINIPAITNGIIIIIFPIIPVAAIIAVIKLERIPRNPEYLQGLVHPAIKKKRSSQIPANFYEESKIF